MSIRTSTQITLTTITEIERVYKEYYLSTSSTELKGGSWSTVAPVRTPGTYIWERTVTVFSDGEKSTTDAICTTGESGIQGCIMRPASEWALGTEYRNDEKLVSGTRYVDPVLVRNDATATGWDAYLCLKTHISTPQNAPGNTEYWEEFGLNVLSIFTSFILAKNAMIKFVSSNSLVILNSEGKAIGGMQGGVNPEDIVLWFGHENPSLAPFRVNMAGQLIGTDVNLTGIINATSGVIGGFRISGTSLTNADKDGKFTNDAAVIFRNDTHKAFAGIGGNLLPAPSGARAIARFENCDDSNWWGLGVNYALLLSTQGVRDCRAIEIDGGTVSGFNMKNKLLQKSEKLTRYDYNVIAINTADAVITLPVMQLHDDGHVIRIKRLGSGSLSIALDYCYTYNGATSRYSRPVLIYDQNSTLTGTNTLSVNSICDSFELVWCRDLIRTVGGTEYYGAWVQYKMPRDW